MEVRFLNSTRLVRRKPTPITMNPIARVTKGRSLSKKRATPSPAITSKPKFVRAVLWARQAARDQFHAECERIHIEENGGPEIALRVRPSDSRR